MSVKVNHIGRFGNHLFQYLAARFIAEENGMKLNSPWVGQALVPIPDSSDLHARDGDGPFLRIGDEHWALDRKWDKANYQTAGYFQVSRWYFQRRKRILDLVQLPRLEPTALGDLIVNVRLGDYLPCNAAIHPSWYLSILEKEIFDRLVLVTDDPGNSYLRVFDKYKPIVVQGGPVEHFRVLRNARRLIMSNSTFCWWAAFLGSAEKLYIFKRWLNHPNAHLGDFPGAVSVDGDLLHERP